MNFKRIELYGFKSFADKLEIDFNTGITCIVGPNGCGKSNVADAIRWVLGEQSAKSLRGKNMVDVIFTGTDSRKMLSYCEVSLIFDNTDRGYPLAFDEIIVTRKLYRGGDGEYFINRVQCRRKDIVDLFRDTGIGRDGYSIIGQGKIDEILSAKAEDRRQIFEEAAGITRFKAKKQETEKNLINTRDNLSRINDILKEITDSLIPLEKQAKDAIKVGELKETLKLQEINSFIYQCDNSNLVRSAINKKLATFTQEINEQEYLLGQMTSRYNINMMDIANTDNMSNKLRDQVTELMVNAEKLLGDNRVLSERLTNLQQESATIITALTTSQVKLEERSSEIIVKRDLRNTRNNEYIDCNLQLTELQSAYNILKDEVEFQEKEIEKTNSLIMDSLDKLTDISTNAVKLIANRDITLDTISENKNEHKEKKSKYESIIRERNNFTSTLESLLKEKEAKTKNKAEADNNYQKSMAELRATEEKKTELTNQRTEINVRIKMLEDYKKEYHGYQPVIRRLMTDASVDERIANKICGVVGDVIVVPKDYQKAIDIALGNRIENIITKDEYDANFLIDIITDNKYGRATFLPMTTVRSTGLASQFDSVVDEDGCVGIASELVNFDSKFQSIITSLLGRIVIVENKEVAIKIFKKYRQGFRIITLSGEAFETSGAISGGNSLGKDNSRILSLDSEIIELTKKLKKANAEYSMVQADVLDLSKESEELSRAFKIIDSQIHKLDIDIGSINQRIASCDAEATDYKEECNRILSIINFNIAKVEELEKLIKVANKEKGDVISERSGADDFVLDAKNAFFNKKQDCEALSRKTTAMLLKTNGLKNEFQGLEAEVDRLEKEIAQLNLNITDLKVRQTINSKSIKDAQSSMDTTIFSVEDKSNLDNMQTQIKEMDAHKKRLQDSLTELDNSRTEINKTLAAVNEKRVREESSLERLDVDIANLTIKIEEEYRLDVNTARAFLIPDFEGDKAISFINKIKKQIDTVGPINELAVEQYATENERQREMSVQLQDLITAEADLVKVIAELKSEMVTRFNTSFKQINLNFIEIFNSLFGGGVGKLELDMTDASDALDAGIDIFAQPPGKKLTNINLLSGGERALTAIAILFAIIKLKPMPFCVLDEIEAALDDANAGLFAQYLRKFSRNTQFIVITHRKPTMELADIMYGVTMQEKGVSKMVSVRLEEAIKSIIQNTTK